MEKILKELLKHVKNIDKELSYLTKKIHEEEEIETFMNDIDDQYNY